MLVKYHTTKDGFFCDKCKASVKEGGALFGCDQCNFDVCEECWRSQKSTAVSFPTQASAQDTALGTMGANNTGNEVIYEGAPAAVNQFISIQPGHPCKFVTPPLRFGRGHGMFASRRHSLQRL